MRKYDSYKDSGIDWIGNIPTNWTTSKLKYHTKKIIDGAHFTPTYIEKGYGAIPFLRVTDLHNKEIDTQNIKYIPREEHEELIKRCHPQKGDLLLSKNGTIGLDRKSTRLNSSHVRISYAVFCLKKKKKKNHEQNQS